MVELVGTGGGTGGRRCGTGGHRWWNWRAHVMEKVGTGGGTAWWAHVMEQVGTGGGTGGDGTGGHM